MTVGLRNQDFTVHYNLGLNICWTDAPGREAEFEAKAGAFEHQANQVADTAIQLANAGGNTNKRLLDQIRQNAEEVGLDLIVQILITRGSHFSWYQLGEVCHRYMRVVVVNGNCKNWRERLQ